ncbi:hypothetical protein [Plebeiibacterium marinum]|uniref:Uncharacterized protein n=1 Tax=Plebeiibacterium marinum TaxID=2992111 RepID=A0AAE3SLD5_9BACT|nr:hypothetical protein [Plebeiobacterium marinum]MCW3807339.1 hypothetical protein [Plebeiobacterium marinum]
MEVLKKETFRCNHQLRNNHAYISTEKCNNQNVEFKYEEKQGRTCVFISSALLKENNYRLNIKGACLSLIIYERREIVKPRYFRLLDKTINEKSTYDRLKSFKYKLPQDIYMISNVSWDKEMMRLEVVLQTDEINVRNCSRIKDCDTL